MKDPRGSCTLCCARPTMLTYSGQYGNAPLAQCTVTRPLGWPKELQQVCLHLLVLRQRVLIAEIEDGNVERQELIGGDEIRVRLNHHLLEILAAIENALDFGRRLFPHMPVVGVLAGDNDRTLGGRWLGGGRWLPAACIALLSGARRGHDKDRK